MNMKPTHWLALATAVAGCAVACGFYLLGQDEDPQSAGPQAQPERRSAGEPGASRTPRRVAGAEFRRQQGPTVGRANGSSEVPGEFQPRKVFGVPPRGGQGLLAESQWLARAAKVEQEANHELRRLVEMLDLDSAQQDRLFGMLARRSSAWMPGMQTSQEPTAGAAVVDGGGMSEADEVMAYLNPDQQQTLIQAEMDRQAWWEEVLPQLLPPQLQEGTTGDAGGTTPTVTDPAPDTKPFEGGELLEE
jgi:hypothetical protein